MSYHTQVGIDYASEDGAVTDDVLLAEAKDYLDGCDWYAVKDVMSCLREAFANRYAPFCDLRCQDFTDLFRALSRKFPAVTFYVWGHGEEPRDVWTREFRDGKVTFR